jgi:hypothetical protein
MQPTPDSMGVNTATPEWSQRVLYANHRYDSRSGGSHSRPESRRDSCYHRYPYLTLANSNDGLWIESTLYQHTYKMPGILWPEICRWNQSRTELRVKEPMNLNSKLITVLYHDYTATEPRWQSTIDIYMTSTEQRISKKEGDSRVRPVMSYRQVIVYSYVLPTSR